MCGQRVRFFSSGWACPSRLPLPGPLPFTRRTSCHNGHRIRQQDLHRSGHQGPGQGRAAVAGFCVAGLRQLCLIITLGPPAGLCAPLRGQGLPQRGRLCPAQQLRRQCRVHCCCQAADQPRSARCRAQGRCADQGQGEQNRAAAPSVDLSAACMHAGCRAIRQLTTLCDFVIAARRQPG